MLTSAVLAVCLNGAINHEGFRHKQYKDLNGMSIGFGYSLTQNPLHLSNAEINRYKQKGISKLEAMRLTKMTFTKLDTELAGLSWYKGLNNTEQYVILDMSYNMGSSGISEFKKTIQRYIGK